MLNLSERLKIVNAEHHQMVASHKKCEFYADIIEEAIGITKEKLRESVYDSMAYLYYSTEDLDSIELTLIPKLSDTFNTKWKRTIEQTTVTYWTDFCDDDGWALYLCIVANISNNSLCTIKKIPTGRTIKKTKQIEYEVQEFETIISCKE